MENGITESEAKENSKKRKTPKIFYDKHGNPMVSMAFRYPLGLYELIDAEAKKQRGDRSDGIIAALEKYYGFKG